MIWFLGFLMHGVFFHSVIGFLRGGDPRGGGNWGTLEIPRKDWGTLRNIRETPPLDPPPLTTL